MNDLASLMAQREDAGRQWEAAYAGGDLAGMDAAMSRIQVLSRQIADLALAKVDHA